MEGDITKSFVNGIPYIEFSERVNQFLINYVVNTVVINLLGQNIGYTTLLNKVYSLWKPSKPIHLMDIGNGYFLVKFQNTKDFEIVLS